MLSLQEVDGVTKKICTVDGSWMGYLDFDDVRYWDARQLSHAQRQDPKPVSDDRALPSDARFREDLSFLLHGDLARASEWKGTLEERQRYDAKLRKEAGKAHHHHK